MSDRCHLCGEIADLQLSHFIPKFVGKWLKKTSMNGFFMRTNNVKKREQDIPKEYWLCRKCEKLFGVWETQFARKIFLPFNQDQEMTFEYNDWMSKFCASLSWRTLTYIRHFHPERSESAEDVNILNNAETHMANFLLGKEYELNEYSQHLIPVESIVEFEGKQPPKNINRYLLRAISMDIIKYSDNILIFTKLPRFIIIGVVKLEKRYNMNSIKISIGEGTINRNYCIPDWIGDYMCYQAESIAKAASTIAENKLLQFDEFISKNIDHVANSKQFEALMKDYELFGKNIFED